MGKIREVFQKMSLKRSLVLLAVFCLSLVSRSFSKLTY